MRRFSRHQWLTLPNSMHGQHSMAICLDRCHLHRILQQATHRKALLHNLVSLQTARCHILTNNSLVGNLHIPSALPCLKIARLQDPALVNSPNKIRMLVIHPSSKLEPLHHSSRIRPNILRRKWELRLMIRLSITTSQLEQTRFHLTYNHKIIIKIIPLQFTLLKNIKHHFHIRRHHKATGHLHRSSKPTNKPRNNLTSKPRRTNPHHLRSRQSLPYLNHQHIPLFLRTTPKDIKHTKGPTRTWEVRRPRRLMQHMQAEGIQQTFTDSVRKDIG